MIYVTSILLTAAAVWLYRLSWRKKVKTKNRKWQ